MKKNKSDELLYAIIEEAKQTLAEAARWKALFGEADSDALVEICVTEIKNLERKYRFLTGRAKALSPEKSRIA